MMTGRSVTRVKRIWLPLTLCLAVAAVSTPAEGVEWWPAPQHDSQHSGKGTNIAPTSGAILWEFTFPSTTGYADVTGGVVFDATRNAVYFAGDVYEGGVNRGWLYSLEATTGSENWRVELGGFVYHTPVLDADGTIFICTYSNHACRAFNPDGSPQWSTTVSANADLSENLALGQNALYALDYSNKKLYSLNKVTGAVNWSYPTLGYVYGMPTLDQDDAAYFGDWGGNFYAINADGSEKWRIQKTNRGYGSVPSVDQVRNVVYFAYDKKLPDNSMKSYLSALSLVDGSTVWDLPFDGTEQVFEYGGVVPRDSSGNLFVITNGYWLYKVSPAGSILWKVTLPEWAGEHVLFSIDGNDNLLIPACSRPSYCSNTAGVWVLDGDDGSLLGTYEYRNYPWNNSPAIGDGIVFVTAGTQQNKVFAFIQGCEDPDGDGLMSGCASGTDNCPATYNIDQNDYDGDAIGDICDVCPLTWDTLGTPGCLTPADSGAMMCQPGTDEAMESDSGNVRLNIPAGALTQETAFAFENTGSTSGYLDIAFLFNSVPEMPAIHFEPEGVTFNAPGVQVCLTTPDLRGKVPVRSCANLIIARDDNADGKYTNLLTGKTCQANTPSAGQFTICGYTTHFSEVGVFYAEEQSQTCYPTCDGFGTWAFEDLWPAKGDYDLNDLVVKYRTTYIGDPVIAVEQVAEVVARGASLHSGFGLALNTAASNVASATLTLDSGTPQAVASEAGQAQATFVVFDDAFQVLSPNSGTYTNTVEDSGEQPSKTYTLHVVLDTPVALSAFVDGPNPFIFRTGERAREVHLPGFPPTDLASGYFTTVHDATNLLAGDPTMRNYYMTENHLPWALDIPHDWSWPLEKIALLNVYPNFQGWAESGGTTKKEWFDSAADDVNEDLLWSVGVSSSILALAAGNSHVCALTAGGGVKCWGYGYEGELGDGLGSESAVPVDVDGLTSGVIAISGTNYHTCALTAEGGVKCWGFNAYGQLGDGTTTDGLTPVTVPGLTGVSAIAAGYYHTCALMTSGGVKCWGANWNGALGDDTTTDSLVPVDVSGLTGVTAIAAGNIHTCALLTSGGVKCWGGNSSGALGDGTTTRSLVPVDVSGIASGATAITTGPDHSCALMADGTVKCWGYNGDGELGDGTMDDRYEPVTSHLSGAATVAGGGVSTCAIVGGGVKCWGNNGEGVVGDGTDINRLEPTDVVNLSSSVSGIAVGGDHACAIVTDGVMCWGNNEYGQVGDGTIEIRYAPVAVLNLP